MVDLVTIGDLNRDWLIQVPRFPFEDDEVPITHAERAIGGDAANCAAAAARLGLKTALVASIGDDLEGQSAIAELNRKGVDTSAVMRNAGMETGLVISVVREDGQRNLYSLRGANANLKIGASQKEMINKSRAVHICDPLVDLIPSLLSVLSEESPLVSLDPGSMTAQRGLESLQPLLEKIRVFLANESEYRLFTGETDLLKAAEKICRAGPQIAVAKLCDEGCLVFSEGKPDYVAGFSVDTVDTTGAGDAFDAAFISALLEGNSMIEAAIFANAVGALATTRLGAQAGHPIKAQALDLIQNQPS